MGRALMTEHVSYNVQTPWESPERSLPPVTASSGGVRRTPRKGIRDARSRFGVLALAVGTILLPVAEISPFGGGGGATAAQAATALTSGQTVSSSVGLYQWKDYYIDVGDWNPRLVIVMEGLDSGDADLYVRKGALPTTSQWHFRPYLYGSDESVTVDAASSPVLSTGRWYISARGYTAAAFELTATLEPVASTRPGMGSTIYTGGTTFRVWAPNAAGVNVAGSFNGWSGTSAPLASEGNGNWSLDVRSVGAGAQYKYVVDTGSSTLWKNDPQAGRVTNSTGNSVVNNPDAFNWGSGSFTTPAWHEMVIYEMHIGTLNDAPGGTPGTFTSAGQKLSYLADLGVNAVKVMPLAEFAGDFSWGYNPAHPFAIESIYGGPDGYKQFVKDAHAAGIAVIQDVVYNHFGPSDLDLWRFDGWSQNGKGGIYFYQDYRSSTPWGDTRPDYGRGEVRSYIRDNAMNWLEEFRVDGLRWDSTVNIRTVNNGGGGDIPDGWSLMQWINNEINGSQGWKISIAEDLQNNEWLTKDTGAGGAGFDAQWDAGFVHPIRDAIIVGNDGDRNMYAVRDAIHHNYNGDAFERVIYTESHDEVANGKSRVPEEIWPGNAGSWYSRKRSTLGAALVMTSPGIPMIFQGQEILEDGWFADTDPVDWSKLTTYSGIRAMYRDLIRLRRNWYNQTRGLRGQGINVHHVNNTDKVIAFHRWESGGAGDDVIVVVNMKNTGYTSYNLGFPRGGTWKVRFNSDWNGYSGDFSNWNSYNTTANWGAKDGMSYNANVGIGPYTAIILSQD